MKLQIQLTDSAIKKINAGNPLIQKEDLKNTPATLPTTWVELTDSRGKFVARGYLGEQNKGLGWVVSFDQTPIDQAFLIRLFNEAKTRRAHYFNDPLTTAFRVFNGEGDGLGGVTIDFYADYLVISWYNQTIYQLKEELIASLRHVYPEAAGIVEKNRFKQAKQESQWLAGEQPAEPLLVKENGVNYAVYFNEGYMTGIFLDQKEVRGRLLETSAGKRVLNMFSYTGAFSVAAAVGGALETTSVDLAQRSLPKTQEQFAVNGLAVAQQKIIVMDTFEYFRYAARKNLTYDLIILDPPSFARNKKKTFSVLKDYSRLIEDSVEILADQGTIIASTNAANFPKKKFQQTIEQALQKQKVTYQLKTTFRLPPDFPAVKQLAESNYLKVLVYEISK